MLGHQLHNHKIMSPVLSRAALQDPQQDALVLLAVSFQEYNGTWFHVAWQLTHVFFRPSGSQGLYAVKAAWGLICLFSCYGGSIVIEWSLTVSCRVRIRVVRIFGL